jgi:Ca2+/Na+ antiporter
MINAILWIYPIINVLVTGIFAAVVARQYLQRHKPYQLYWSIALSMAFIATLSYVAMLALQPSSAVGMLCFRLYYILGAALMPSWLGLGSIALVAHPRMRRICLIVLSILSVIAAVLIATAPINTQQLSQIAGTPGTGILLPVVGAWLITIIVLNTLGVVAVVGVAIYSGWKLFVRQGTSSMLWANILILSGDLINAAAGTTARLGVKNIFWIVMALGWTVFFVGVLLASKPRSHVMPEKKQETRHHQHNEVKI